MRAFLALGIGCIAALPTQQAYAGSINTSSSTGIVVTFSDTGRVEGIQSGSFGNPFFARVYDHFGVSGRVAGTSNDVIATESASQVVPNDLRDFDDISTSANTRVIQGGRLVPTDNAFFQVTHDFQQVGPSSAFDGRMVKSIITVRNVAQQTLENVKYRHVADWDIAPDDDQLHEDVVTIGGVPVSEATSNPVESHFDGIRLSRSSAPNYGDCEPNPLGQCSANSETLNRVFANYQNAAINREGTVTVDMMSEFTIDLGDLAPNAHKTFEMYWGAGYGEVRVLEAIADLAAEVYAIGQESDDIPSSQGGVISSHSNSSPRTVFLAFKGVGGESFTTDTFQSLSTQAEEVTPLGLQSGTGCHLQVVDTTRQSFLYTELEKNDDVEVCQRNVESEIATSATGIPGSLSDVVLNQTSSPASCADAYTLTPGENVVAYLPNATTTSLVPCAGNYFATWFKFVAEPGVEYAVDGLGSRLGYGSNTFFYLGTGSNCASMSCVSSNDDFSFWSRIPAGHMVHPGNAGFSGFDSRIVIPAQAVQTTYYLAVRGFGNGYAGFQFNVRLTEFGVQPSTQTVTSHETYDMLIIDQPNLEAPPLKMQLLDFTNANPNGPELQPVNCLSSSAFATWYDDDSGEWVGVESPLRQLGDHTCRAEWSGLFQTNEDFDQVMTISYLLRDLTDPQYESVRVTVTPDNSRIITIDELTRPLYLVDKFSTIPTVQTGDNVYSTTIRLRRNLAIQSSCEFPDEFIVVLGDSTSCSYNSTGDLSCTHPSLSDAEALSHCTVTAQPQPNSPAGQFIFTTNINQVGLCGVRAGEEGFRLRQRILMKQGDFSLADPAYGAHCFGNTPAQFPRPFVHEDHRIANVLLEGTVEATSDTMEVTQLLISVFAHGVEPCHLLFQPMGKLVAYFRVEAATSTLLAELDNLSPDDVVGQLDGELMDSTTLEEIACPEDSAAVYDGNGNLVTAEVDHDPLDRCYRITASACQVMDNIVAPDKPFDDIDCEFQFLPQISLTVETSSEVAELKDGTIPRTTGFTETVVQIVQDGGSNPVPSDSTWRIAGGGTSGRVEVFRNGEWGTVCVNGFTKTQAQAICQLLGFEQGRKLGPGSVADGGANMPIWYDATSHNQNTPCNIIPNLITGRPDCVVGDHNCEHRQDVGVQCWGVPGSTQVADVFTSVETYGTEGLIEEECPIPATQVDVTPSYDINLDVSGTSLNGPITAEISLATPADATFSFAIETVTVSLFDSVESPSGSGTFVATGSPQVVRSFTKSEKEFQFDSTGSIFQKDACFCRDIDMLDDTCHWHKVTLANLNPAAASRLSDCGVPCQALPGQPGATLADIVADRVKDRFIFTPNNWVFKRYAERRAVLRFVVTARLSRCVNHLPSSRRVLRRTLQVQGTTEVVQSSADLAVVNYKDCGSIHRSRKTCDRDAECLYSIKNDGSRRGARGCFALEDFKTWDCALIRDAKDCNARKILTPSAQCQWNPGAGCERYLEPSSCSDLEARMCVRSKIFNTENGGCYLISMTRQEKVCSNLQDVNCQYVSKRHCIKGKVPHCEFNRATRTCEELLPPPTCNASDPFACVATEGCAWTGSCQATQEIC